MTKDDIEDVVARWTGVPMTAIREEEVGQAASASRKNCTSASSARRRPSRALARAIRRSRAGLKSPKRPAGSFLFLGPTGVGKTEVARALAEFLFGSEKIADPLRHVRVHGEALGLEADRLASGLRGLRGGRTAHRAREARTLLGDPARRNREGASGRLQHPAAGF